MTTGSFEVRVAVPGDEAGVTTLLKASYSELMAASYDPALLAAALPLMTRANPSLLASDRYYVAEREDAQIIGCGGWSLTAR